MLDIINNKESIYVIYNNTERGFPKDGSLNAIISRYSRSIRLFYKDAIIANEYISSVKINGEPTTLDSIDKDISFIYELSQVSVSCGGSGGGSESGGGTPSEGDTAPYTKLEYTDPLVFPKPVRSGHIVEFYKDGGLKESYRYDGFNWDVLGIDPNLVFIIPKPSDAINDIPVAVVRYVHQDRLKYSFHIDKGAEFTSPITVSDIIVSSKDYTLTDVSFVVKDDGKTHTVNGLRTYGFGIIADVSNGMYPVNTKVDISNLEVSGVSMANHINSLSLDTVKGVSEEDNFPQLSLMGSNIAIKNSNIGVTSIQIGSPKEEDNNVVIDLDNNSCTGRVTITPMVGLGTGGATITLNLVNNKGVSLLTMTNLRNIGNITSGEFLFDPTTLKTVNLRDTTMSDGMIEKLVVSLTKEPFTVASRSLIAPTMEFTQEQKDKLTDAGWKIS